MGTKHFINLISAAGMFTNLEHLEFTPDIGDSANVDKLIQTEAFELPHLTSLKSDCPGSDFTKWTRLKALQVRLDTLLTI